MMACGISPYEMSNWNRKRFCSQRCRDKARDRPNERSSRGAKKARVTPVTPREKPEKAPPVEPWQSRLNITAKGSTRSLSETLVDTLKLHPDLGMFLADPNTMQGRLDTFDTPSP